MIAYLFEWFGEGDGVFERADTVLVAEVDEGKPLQLNNVDMPVDPPMALASPLWQMTKLVIQNVIPLPGRSMTANVVRVQNLVE